VSTVDEWFAAARVRRLLVQTCRACGHHQHHPRAVCTRCGRTDRLGWTEAAGTGTVDSFTVVHRSPGPGFDPPYVIARVRLAEGPLLLTRIVGCPPGTVRCDQPVRLGWWTPPGGEPLPVFTPEG
jgi:uncharacterized protein